MTQQETPTVYYFTSGADDARHGPYSGSQLKQLAKQGILKPTDIIWQAGSNKTTPAAKVKGLFSTAGTPVSKPEMPMAAVALATPSPFATVSPFAAAPMKQESPPVVAEMVYEAEIVEEVKSNPAPATSTKAAASTAWLEDPMREISVRFGGLLRKLFGVTLVGSIVLGIFSLLLPEGVFSALNSAILYSIWTLFLGYLVGLVWWRAFAPRRATDVFYLRSFQNDQASWPIRVAIQEALGDGVRVSGIRDPRQRITVIADGLSPWMKAMRHCTPKFMDLEAEEDWQSRLWNSLQHGKMAVVDLSVTTPFVLDEVRLVTRAITVDRTLFLGSLQRTEKDLRSTIAAQLGGEAGAKARVLIWPGNEIGAATKDRVRQFRDELKHVYNDIASRPALATTPVPPEFVVEPKAQSKTPMSRTMMRWMNTVQLLLIAVYFLLLLFSRAVSSSPSVQGTIVLLGLLPFTALNSVLFFWNCWAYIRDVGIFRRRVKAIVLLVTLLILMTFIGRGFALLPELPMDVRLAPSATEIEEDGLLLGAENQAVR